MMMIHDDKVMMMNMMMMMMMIKMMMKKMMMMLKCRSVVAIISTKFLSSLLSLSIQSSSQTSSNPPSES
jgi:hypothetical protein